MADIQDVVAKLAGLTEKRQVPWKTTVDKSAFAATFGKLSVLISLEIPSESPWRRQYRLAVLDEEGNEIGSALHRTNVLGDKYEELVALFDSAKHSALSVDQKLEELLEAMNLIAEP